MRVALAYNLKPGEASGNPRLDFYAEWDDCHTVEAVTEALAEEHDVTGVEADEGIVEKLKGLRPEFVFNMAEGINSPSREAQVPTVCEMLGIPYTGSDPFTMTACLNKARAKEILSYHRIPTPAFLVTELPEPHLNGIGFPLIVKPLWEGSSMGIRDDSVVEGPDELRTRLERLLGEYRQPALVEAFLPGREFTAALLGNGDDLRVLPIIEIEFGALPRGAHPIYSYEAKWIWDTPDKPLRIFVCPARIDAGLEQRIRDVCARAYRALGCRDWCRIDVRCDLEGNPHVIELNPLPGILPDPEDNSCFPKAARAAGMGYGRLIREVLNIADRRHGVRKG